VKTLQLLLALTFLATHTSDVLAQVDTIAYHHQSRGVEVPGENVIGNITALDNFFEKLFLLRRDHDRVVNIVHIGDSHIQADYMTAVVRRNMQKWFGNAGRGLLVPFAVAGTNSPVNFISTSETKWTVKRCVHPSLPGDIGIGGITLTTSAPRFRLSFAMNDLWTEHLITQATIFLKTSNRNTKLQLTNEKGKALGAVSADARTQLVKIKFPEAVTQFTIDGVVADTLTKPTSIFGVNVTSGDNGVVYHAIGVNGAKYQHYNQTKYFVSQVSELQPDLIIMSLGTNESMEKVDDRIFAAEVQRLVQALQKLNANTPVLIITPPDCLLKGQANPNVAVVGAQLLRYAVDHGLAFYDFNRIMGGSGAAAKWKALGMMRPDGVHFSKEAYEYVGSLLFEAIAKHYNSHVSLRHQ
jgi:lysophospholipase L1-like esterase